MNKISLSKTETLTNVGNSILKFFDVKELNTSYAPLDKVLKNTNKKKICLVLFDAFGKAIIEKYKRKVPYLYSHVRFEFNSVYPPTTVAATTSLTTGLYPIQTGYFGWTQYFKEYDDYIHVFLNDSKNLKKTYPNIQKTILKVNYIWDYINEQTDKKATSIQSFTSNKYPFEILNYHRHFRLADKLIKSNDFVYCYCTEPDHLMHTFGTNSKIVEHKIIYLEKKLKKLVKNNPDTLFILVADHGMKDIKTININNYPDFIETLVDKQFSIEPRTASFKVKDKDKFISLYHKYFEDKFVLKTKEEILNEHFFGYGEPCNNFNYYLGDFFFLSNSEYALSEDDQSLKGHHAGITDDETKLYMMIFNE